ncbi:MAG: acyltransferase [Hyphomicrobiales bacterium]|nr:MAG: acyltransferase [Hyphomicrobiales bacterium]
MVVAHHVAQRISPDILTPGQQGLAMGVQMFAFGVAAFFVLSGYLLARPFWVALDKGDPMPSLRTYAIRRGARILPAFWLNLTIVFVLSFTLLGTPFDGPLLLRYLSGMFLVADFHWLTWFPVEFNGPLWSIGAEITSYALLPLCLWLLFKLPFTRGWLARLGWVAIIGALLGLQLLALRYLMPDANLRGWEYGMVGGAKFWWPNYNPIAFYAIFAVGALAAGVQVKLATLRSGWFDLVALGGLGLAIWALWAGFPYPDAYGWAGIPYGYPWFPLGVALILVGTPSSVVLHKLTELSPIAYVARVSFGVYIWHYMLMEIVRVLWQPRYIYAGMINAGAWAWISLAVVVMSFFIATLSYALLEEPIIRWARGLEKRATPANPTLSPAAG